MHKKSFPDGADVSHLPDVTSGKKNPLWYTLPGRLKLGRTQCGASSRTIALAAGLTPSTATRMENGEVTPQIDTVEKIAKAIGVQPCWLAFGYDGDKPFREKVSRPDKSHTDIKLITAEDATNSALVGKRLQYRRKALNLSLRQVGTAAGISYQTVNLIECGEAVPKVDSLHRLAIALDVAPCWLAYGVGDPPIDPAEAGLQRGTQSEPTEGAKA